MLGKTEGRRRRGHQRMRWLEDITDAMDINLGKLRETVRDRILMGDGEGQGGLVCHSLQGHKESDTTG